MASFSRTNKKAGFDYEISKTRETGIILMGHEVKSIKNNRFSCSEAVVRLDKGKIVLINMHIDAYTHTAPALLRSYTPNHTRTLLLHRKEIGSIASTLSQGGYGLVLTKIYAKNHFIKCEIGLGKKKKNVQKKQILKEKDLDRQAKRDIASFS